MAARETEKGFTLVEIMITTAILVALCALTLINLGKPQTTASLSGAVDMLVADLRSQQQLAMSGDSGSTSSQQPQGLRLESGQYTLFAGSSYNGADTNNYTAELGDGISLSTTFPGSTILFDKSSGEVNGFSAGNNTITIQKNGDSKTITINRFGTVTVQ